MKKIISAILVVLMISALVLALSSCKKEPDSITFDDGTVVPIIPEDEIDPATVPPAQAPGSSYMYIRGSLTLAKDPVIEDGMLVLYFNETLNYTENSDCYIGVQTPEEADSIAATPVIGAYPDMAVDGGYCGIALRPSADLFPAYGTYTITVSIDASVVESFEYTAE